MQFRILQWYSCGTYWTGVNSSIIRHILTDSIGITVYKIFETLSNILQYYNFVKAIYIFYGMWLVIRNTKIIKCMTIFYDNINFPFHTKFKIHRIIVIRTKLSTWRIMIFRNLVNLLEFLIIDQIDLISRHDMRDNGWQFISIVIKIMT